MCASVSLPFSGTVVPQNLALPEGKSLRAPINTTGLHRVSTAYSILISQGSQLANPNRTDKAVDARVMKRQRLLKAKQKTKARINLIELSRISLSPILLSVIRLLKGLMCSVFVFFPLEFLSPALFLFSSLAPS